MCLVELICGLVHACLVAVFRAGWRRDEDLGRLDVALQGRRLRAMIIGIVRCPLLGAPSLSLICINMLLNKAK